MAQFKLPLALFLGAILVAPPLLAADPPSTPNLELAGISFDDPPMRLPVTPNLHRAMNQIAGDLGKHCSVQEAYGWRVQQTEQERVNGIFSSAATKLSEAGYNLTPQTPPSATRDITIFLAQRPAQDLLFLWSAGELGLVLLVCDAPNGVLETARSVNSPDNFEAAPEQNKSEIKVRKSGKPKPASKVKSDKSNPMPTATKTHATDAPMAIGIDDLPPVVHETTTATPIAPPLPKETPKSAPPEVAPEVKAMLESLPEKPPAAVEAVPSATPPTPQPLATTTAPKDVPTIVVPPTQK